MKRSPYIILKVFILLLSLAALPGCEWLDPDEGEDTLQPERPAADPEPEKVLLLYSAGHNSLRDYLLDDIRDLKKGWLPGTAKEEDILLVYTHSSKSRYSNSTATSPYLIRLYRSRNGAAVADTLVTYPAGTISSSARQMSEVLSLVKDRFPAQSYGMIFSSHATGYLPAGYYQDALSYKYKEEATNLSRRGMMYPASLQDPTPVPYIEPEYDPSLPMVKSIGQDAVGSDSYEMEFKDFADAIPFRLDYILFDACLMGGIEIAYDLRGKAGQVGFSQAEVLAEGLNYKELTKHLLQSEIPDPQAVCEDYYKQYEVQSGLYRSATISLVNPDETETLASACAPLFDKYRSRILELDENSVQGFGGNRKYFFDLVDIVRCAGATEEEMEVLQQAMDKVVSYKNTTGQYYSTTDGDIHVVDHFSGLSMYKPSLSSTGEELNMELNKYYRTLRWNKATELVGYQK